MGLKLQITWNWRKLKKCWHRTFFLFSYCHTLFACPKPVIKYFLTCLNCFIPFVFGTLTHEGINTFHKSALGLACKKLPYIPPWGMWLITERICHQSKKKIVTACKGRQQISDLQSLAWERWAEFSSVTSPSSPRWPLFLPCSLPPLPPPQTGSHLLPAQLWMTDPRAVSLKSIHTLMGESSQNKRNTILVWGSDTYCPRTALKLTFWIWTGNSATANCVILGKWLNLFGPQFPQV